MFLSLSAFPDIEYVKPLFEFVGRYGVGGITSVSPLICNTFRDFPAALTSACFCQAGYCSYYVILFQRAQLVLLATTGTDLPYGNSHQSRMLSEFNKLLLAISSFLFYLIKLAKV